jgi:hypothetical protein
MNLFIAMNILFKKRRNQIIAGVIIVLALFLIWINFLFVKNCEDNICFYDSLRNCERAKFISYSNITFEYIILRASGKNCAVNVKLLDAALPERDLGKIRSQEMKCYLPYGMIISPETDLSLCSGKLKESFQNLIINKLHTYIVQNLGEINANLLKV